MRTLTRPTRRGVLSMELVLTLPILMVVLLALFEFSFLFTARGDVAEAARIGARFAATHGATEAEIGERVREVLGEQWGAEARIGVEWGRHSGELVTVGVWVPSDRVAPNLLWMIGYNLEGRHIYAQSHAVME